MASRSGTFPIFASIATGEVAGNTAATQMPTVTSKLIKIKAHADNAGKVYIGAAGVTAANGATDTTTGYQLSAKDETPWLPLSNLNMLYRICDNAGDDVTYIVLA